MKFLGRLFLCAMIAFALARAALAVTPSPATARLDFEDGTCSGTVVASNVILSAAHCFQEEENEFGFVEPPPVTMKVDGYQVKILAVVFDGNDHALAKVDFTFHNFAKLAKPPAVGAHVHYCGNPDKINDVYREGYVTSYHHSEMMIDINGFFGDSGAGIFDEAGNVVAVVSFIDTRRHAGRFFSLMGANAALEFTPLQYDMMGVTAP